MNQQKDFVFVIKKSHSILKASFFVEVVSFIVTLMDSLIAGNLIGGEALVAIGLLTPLSSLITFIASMSRGDTRT